MAKLKNDANIDRFNMVGDIIKINKNIHKLIDMTRKKHINKVLESISKGDVNSNNFWSQIKKIGRESQIETKNIVDDDGHIIDDPLQANVYVENYYKNLYTIRPATSEFIGFEKQVY